MASRSVALFVAPSPLLLSRARSLPRPHRRVRTPAGTLAPMVFILDWLFPRAGRPQRDGPIAPPEKHVVLGTSPAQPEGGWKPPLEQAIFGLGCFWGAERKFWTAPGVHTTSVGYAGGMVPNPRYRPVCSGRTGHAEVVNVVFDQSKTSFEDMLDIFWDAHDPTTKNRQGNDVGSQYRSAIFYYNDAQRKLAEQTRDHFNDLLKEAGRNACTTEIKPAGKYYFAEEYHQQYLHKNPTGYCGLGGTGLYRPLKKAASEVKYKRIDKKMSAG